MPYCWKAKRKYANPIFCDIWNSFMFSSVIGMLVAVAIFYFSIQSCVCVRCLVFHSHRTFSGFSRCMCLWVRFICQWSSARSIVMEKWFCMKFDKDKRNLNVQNNFIIIAQWLMLRLLFSFIQVHVFRIIFPIAQQAIALAAKQTNQPTNMCDFFHSKYAQFTSLNVPHLFLMHCCKIPNVSIAMQSIDILRSWICVSEF